MKALISILIISLLTLNSFAQKTPQWRPNYHFSPQKNWTNDPNGLVYLDGKWHLFFQYNPEGDQWGHMSWGHAVSEDLMTWEELPLAIPEGKEYIFSGCIVVDKTNASGLFAKGKQGLVAIYTADFHGEKEEQHLAYSSDGGMTWTKYEANPVLGQPQRGDQELGVFKDFRDPNVFWYEPTNEWIMAVVLPKEFVTQFYASKNLIDWEWRSDFGNKGDLRKIWECPSLSQVRILNVDGKTIDNKWLLAISSNGPYEGYVGMQYFLGAFDGTTFSEDQSLELPAYLDYGKDYYAAIPFANSNRNIMIGWMNNWTYAKEIPTNPWRGQMNLPRQLTLQKDRNGIHLTQFPPIEVIANKHWKTVTQLSEMPLSSSGGIEWRTQSMSYHIQLELQLIGNEQVSLEILKEGNEKTVLTYNPATQELLLDRRNSGEKVSDTFPNIERAPLAISQNKLELDIFVDNCSVEIFANRGQVTFGELVFPTGSNLSWQLIGSGSQSKAKEIVVREWE